MSDLTHDEILHAARILSRTGEEDGHFFPDSGSVYKVLDLLQTQGVDLSSLRPDPAHRYASERRTPRQEATPFWLVFDQWTGDVVLSVAETSLVDAEGLAHDTAARLNAS